MLDLSTTRKGAAAEAEITAALTRLDLVVSRPIGDGGRYDLVLDTGERLLRLQCKWASFRRGVLSVHCTTCRHTPSGYRRSTYSAGEVDAIAAYAPHTDACYLIPIQEVDGNSAISLRVTAPGNNQALGVRWARDYELGPALRRHWNVGLMGDPDR